MLKIRISLTLCLLHCFEKLFHTIQSLAQHFRKIVKFSICFGIQSSLKALVESQSLLTLEATMTNFISSFFSKKKYPNLKKRSTQTMLKFVYALQIRIALLINEDLQWRDYAQSGKLDRFHTGGLPCILQQSCLRGPLLAFTR